MNEEIKNNEEIQQIDNSLKTTEHKSHPIVNGNILIFHTFDVGDHIELGKIKSKRILKAHDKEPFPHFKNYHIPLTVDISTTSEKSNGVIVFAKIHSFGVLSLNYIIPFAKTFEDLKLKLIEEVELYKTIAKKDAKMIFNNIRDCITEENFFNLKSSYYAVHAENKGDPFKNKELIANYGPTIASLLKLETKVMSKFQIEETLRSSTTYYGTDLMVICPEGAFIYDDEYLEPLEFFELAGIQKVELQYFDRLLDKKLNHFYNSDAYKIPLISYIPILGNRIDSMLMDLAKLRVDISVITERMKNDVNMIGDSYFQRLYNVLIEDFKLREWKNSIDEKLFIINEIYTIRKNNSDTVRAELLEILIIILITLELFK